MRIFGKMKRWDEATIDWYAGRHGDDPTTRAVVDAAPLAHGDRVLDIGCGTGASLRRALARGAGQGVGIDLPRMIAHARAAGMSEALAFHPGRAEALPFADAFFDGVLAVNAVHHWEDAAAGLSEAVRVLRAGGWIAIGGERFGEATLPGGQDYSGDLAARGIADILTSDIPGGFVTLGRKRERT